jgi:Phytanoyl-CoA dioxygenase (PhyH)
MPPAGTLSFRGIALGTGAGEFGELHDASSLIAAPAAARERADAEGYLLMRGMLDRDVVLAAREEILMKFAIVGEVDAINHPLADGVQSPHSFIDQVNLIAFTESLRSGMAYSRVVLAPEIMGFFDGFLGGPSRSFDFRWPRFMRKGEATGIHCDGPYITRGTTNVWSAWIPLGDISPHEGALMILEGTHKNEQLRRSYGTRDADRDQIGWLSNEAATLRKRMGGRWLTTGFRAGDVLIFGPYLVHASLDNNSEKLRCRLSSDTRYLLQGDALDPRWNGGVSNPHGGRSRVFLPGTIGAAGGRNNKDFQEEWKDVDELGRLVVHA